MRHRGPDASGQLFRPAFGLGLGSVRLSIIDIGGGDQPISNEDGTIWTVFNGEIYNFQDLRTQLQQRGHQFKTRADTEVLVHLYEEKRADLVDDLIGDFAFAIWDDRTGELLLARDRLGVKPLYYADHNGQLAFASTLPALLEGCAAPREIDPRALLSYLTFRCIQAPLSVYRHMRKLPPGHVLTARGHDVRTRQYWRLKLEPDESRPLESFSEELDALLNDAIRRQMVADVPLGAFLSGGLDSSAVVRAMTEFSSGPVKAFSIGFREHRYDESPYFKLLARELGIEHHQLVFEPHLLDDVQNIVQMFGEPCAITSGFPLYYLSKLARRPGRDLRGLRAALPLPPIRATGPARAAPAHTQHGQSAGATHTHRQDDGATRQPAPPHAEVLRAGPAGPRAVDAVPDRKPHAADRAGGRARTGPRPR